MMTKILNILTINNKNLKELKSFIIKISQAIYIYEILGKEGIESNFYKMSKH